MSDELERLRAENAKLKEEVEELNASFQLRWQAGMRASMRWREERPVERELILPDHADLCIWLFEQLLRMESVAAAAVWLIPNGVTCGELRGLLDKAQEAFADKERLDFMERQRLWGDCFAVCDLDSGDVYFRPWRYQNQTRDQCAARRVSLTLRQAIDAERARPGGRMAEIQPAGCTPIITPLSITESNSQKNPPASQ